MALTSKATLRTVANTDFIVHSESICEALNLVEVSDKYAVAVWNYLKNV